MNSTCTPYDKVRGTLNKTNWAHHIQACKNKRFKTRHYNIKSFFHQTGIKL